MVSRGKVFAQGLALLLCKYARAKADPPLVIHTFKDLLNTYSTHDFQIQRRTISCTSDRPDRNEQILLEISTHQFILN